MVETVNIGGRLVGPDHRCLIIAEAGVNHNGSLATARTLVEAAAKAGADVVKFQTFDATRLVTAGAAKADYQRAVTDPAESQLEMLQRLELSKGDHRALADQCAGLGIVFMSTPFDESSVDFLAELGVPAFKIGSGEITNLPLLSHVARKSVPVILSTGMSTLDEVAAAVATIRHAGNADLVLLHCVSGYPADPGDANLRAMQTMANAFHVPVGFSDHTLGVEVSLAAVALGACVIEKHVTLDRTLPGPDHQSSLVPDELAALVRGIRLVENARGDGRKQPVGAEAGTAAAARRSLVAVREIPRGSTLTETMVAARRPGTGLPPSMLDRVVGRVARRTIAEGSLISLEMLE